MCSLDYVGYSTVRPGFRRPPEQLQEIFDNYEFCHHRMREFFILALLGGWLSIGGVARQLGASRQLACRLVHESREAS